jgi:hypothetical protein
MFAAIVAYVMHLFGASIAWFWANLGSITQFIGILSIFLGATNKFVKAMVLSHPTSKFWLYVAKAFGPDPENALGQVISFLDKLACMRSRRGNLPPAIQNRITRS